MERFSQFLKHTFKTCASLEDTNLGVNPNALAPWNPQTYNAPEPSSGLLLVVGAALLALRRKKETAHG
ncbi:MAG: PEP-CTERM sorting domain-containing protein [Kiritimatiellae bacterium]|nr:PEP-CTERM sorting domain-containing protein [Kiritimatiellia bacterium]